VRHHTTPAFWQLYEALPQDVRDLADKSFTLLRDDPKHPSLHFKKVGTFWSARVGAHYRALCIQDDEDFVWFWIGDHPSYDRLVRRG
jgi:hypothetical protein